MITDLFFKLFYYFDLNRKFPFVRHKIKALETEQYENYTKLQDKQFQNISALVIHAFENCPYYHNIFIKTKFDPYNLKTWDDFNKIPVLQKKDIQKNLNDILASNVNFDRLFKDATGGSTGEPLIFYHDRLCKEWFEACNFFINNWWGVMPWFKKAFLWGADRDIPELSIKERLRLKLHRSTFLNSFDMDEVKMQTYLEYIKNKKPQYIQGYASSLDIFSKYINKNEALIPQPMAVRSSAETLTEDRRQTITQCFGKNVFNFYGSREITNIAAECPSHSGLHTLSPIRYVEVIDSNGKNITNKPGRIIVTDLINYSMPFIRYEIGDIGILTDEQCDCGRSFPKLKHIEGRITDFIQTKNGKYIHGEYFTHLFYGIKEVASFQVYQKSLDSIEVNIVEATKIPDDIIASLKKSISEKMGKDITILINFVDSIPLTKTGKKRFTISDIPSKF